MHWFHLRKQNNSVSTEINNNKNKNMARFASVSEQDGVRVITVDDKTVSGLTVDDKTIIGRDNIGYPYLFSLAKLLSNSACGLVG